MEPQAAPPPAHGAEAHLPSQDSLALLHEVSRELSSILHPERLLHRVAERVKGLIDYQLFGVLLFDPQTGLLEHAISVCHNGCRNDHLQMSLGQGLSGAAASLRRPVRIADVRLDARYISCDERVRSELVVPMMIEDRLIGVIDLESYHVDAFGAEAEQLMSTLAANLAVALENARLYETMRAEERRLDQELKAARQVQQMLLPRSSPWAPGVQTAVAWCPARHLGGDFYDFIPYDDHRTVYVVADVAGKGTGAALYGAMAVGALRGYAAESQCDPSCLMAYLNDELAGKQVERRFLALTVAMYDRRDHSFTIANAGLPYPYLLRDGKAEEVTVAGVPIGAMSNIQYTQTRVTLEPGDALIFATDGIEEAQDSDGRAFGEDRARRHLESLAQRPATDIAQGLLQATDAFLGESCEPSDDRTVVVIKRGLDTYLGSVQKRPFRGSGRRGAPSTESGDCLSDTADESP